MMIALVAGSLGGHIALHVLSTHTSVTSRTTTILTVRVVGRGTSRSTTSLSDRTSDELTTDHFEVVAVFGNQLTEDFDTLFSFGHDCVPLFDASIIR
ncbi:hypothetical protein D3C75_906550 [compost metagenome]